MRQNAIMEKFKSAYKAHYSTETVWLRVYNDVMFNIARDNGTLFVLLDLTTVFETIDHQILFHILEHSLYITDLDMCRAFDTVNRKILFDHLN